MDARDKRLKALQAAERIVAARTALNDAASALGQFGRIVGSLGDAS